MKGLHLSIVAGFEAILNPLITLGTLRHPESAPAYWGPGCSVQANAEGVRQLAADDRILQIVAVE